MLESAASMSFEYFPSKISFPIQPTLKDVLLEHALAAGKNQKEQKTNSCRNQRGF